MKVNYVMACWMGARNYDDSRHAKDRSLFVREHLAQLEGLAHSLDQITVVLAEGGDPEADAYVKGLKTCGDTPVCVLTRENIGLSYASWNHAYDTFADEFDYSIIVEDDYVPVVEGFDAELVDFADRYKTYVCSLASADGRHGAITNGIIPHDVWEAVAPVPYDDSHAQTRGNRSQTIWSGHFFGEGYPLKDWMSKFSSPFRQARGATFWYGHAAVQPLFIPIQAMGRPNRIRIESMSITATVDNRGKVTPHGSESEYLWNHARSWPIKDRWVGRFT